MILISKPKKKDFHSLGNVNNVREIDRGISFSLSEGKGEILIYSDSLVRVRLTHNSKFDLDHSYAVIKPLEKWETPSYDFKENSHEISLSTSKLSIIIQKEPFQIIWNDLTNENYTLCEDDASGMGACSIASNETIRSYKKLRDGEHFFGFGEKTGPLDKCGEHLIMHGRDMPYRGDIEPLYQNHPFFLTINEQNGISHGIFLDNISKTTFDMGKEHHNEYYFDAATGDLNYYFIYGPKIDDVLEQYTELTGHMEMPPKWTIGYHQCKYSYENEEQIQEITSKFRKEHIPADVIWFDIHYMDGYRVFTFDTDRFPQPKRLMTELDSIGFKPIVIVDPGVKVDEAYDVYQELIENNYYAPREDGTPALGLVWPGLTHFPDFTREEVRNWWADKHEFYFNMGIKGIWNDMNEPAFTINPIASKLKRLHHEDMYLVDQGRHTKIEHSKNIYALCEAQATWSAFKKFLPEKRPFVLTRSGYSGIQRYAAIWTGDNWTNWKGITLAVRMCVNLNLSAQTFVGSDVGGFAGIWKFLLHDKKQYIRWIQSGVFYPFCRVHSAHGMKPQDPFSYGELAQSISKKYIELRYRLLPYWYTLFYDAYKKGAPVLRPLFYHSITDPECYNPEYENEFFLGENLLVIPIAKPNVKYKKIYLPKGNWIHFWNMKEFEGQKEHLIPITLEDIPIFVKKGSIIPFQPVVEYIGEKPIDIITLNVYVGDPGTSSSCRIYEDDGTSMEYDKSNNFFLMEVEAKFEEKENKLSFHILHNKYNPSWKKLKIVIFSDGQKQKEIEKNFPSDNKIITL